ncbi:MAG: metal-dependent transcriptional regulator [Massilibacteroides sp.]|nr:metal-dependent transcriptional regulator [Bacteroidales bacterium]MDD2437395.1 metal-dependent transcriptional regulator [Massilibacteroides sp.]MDD3064265.1 metal-dependent transcriptional regulator [Massilibacteroides sp.]MDD4661233.1 metal-dependent transcriptional regulator [Massilibacteroides sp.]
MTVSVDDFVKTIYKQSVLAKADTKLSTISGLLNVSNAATTDMARKLAQKGLVNYTKYKPLTLTNEGEKLALNVLRKHRLWETFLFQTLGLSLYEIHQEAENLEHFTSDFLAGKIEEYLGNPETTPQGAPIPSFNGQIHVDSSQLLLSEAEAGVTYEVSRLSGSEKDFLDFCRSNGITIGAEINIEKQYLSGKMTEITIDKSKILLHEDVANIIYVRRLVNH